MQKNENDSTEQNEKNIENSRFMQSKMFESGDFWTSIEKILQTHKMPHHLLLILCATVYEMKKKSFYINQEFWSSWLRYFVSFWWYFRENCVELERVVNICISISKIQCKVITQHRLHSLIAILLRLNSRFPNKWIAVVSVGTIFTSDVRPNIVFTE